MKKRFKVFYNGNSVPFSKLTTDGDKLVFELNEWPSDATDGYQVVLDDRAEFANGENLAFQKANIVLEKQPNGTMRLSAWSHGTATE